VSIVDIFKTLKAKKAGNNLQTVVHEQRLVQSQYGLCKYLMAEKSVFSPNRTFNRDQIFHHIVKGDR
jgi:hypothetical protein